MSEGHDNVDQGEPTSRAGGTFTGRFAHIREGEVDPENGLKVHWLIRVTGEFAVYLDEELDIWWRVMDCQELVGTDVGKAIVAAEVVAATPIDHIGDRHKKAARLMLGEAIALALTKDVEGSKEITEKARFYIETRNLNLGRTWYVVGSSCAMLVALILMIAIYFVPGLTLSEVPLGTILGCGAAGAFLSVLARLTQIPLDSSAGKFGYYMEGAIRIIVGVLGAILVALAVSAKLLLNVVESDNVTYVMLTICFVAGASERLVPNFIRGLETSTGPTQT